MLVFLVLNRATIRTKEQRQTWLNDSPLCSISFLSKFSDIKPTLEFGRIHKCVQPGEGQLDFNVLYFKCEKKTFPIGL